MDRITAIRKSLAGFTCGILAFIPLLGILPAARALHHWVLVTRKLRGEWNPARRYLLGGILLAVLGVTLGTFVPCLWLIVQANIASSHSSGFG
jgi:hypothetical protein